MFCSGLGVLDKLLGLDIVHAVHTGNTVTVPSSAPLLFRGACDARGACCGVPDGKHTSSLSEVVLLLYTTDPLLQDGGDLGRGSLCVDGI